MRDKPTYSDECAKMRYASEEEALLVAHLRKRTAGVKLRAYPCPKCLGYHLTSQG